SYARTARSSAASTSPSTRRPQPESSIKRPRTSRLSRSRESRSSAFKKAMRERSSSSAAEPVVLDGTIVGAVGAPARTVEEDIAVAEAAIAALGHQARSSDDLNRKTTP